MSTPLIETDPDLAAAVAEPAQQSWTLDIDMPFRADVPTSDGTARRGWGKSDQAAFERVCPVEADGYTDDLIGRHASLWPLLMPDVLRAREPDMLTEIERLAEAREIGRPASHSRWETAKEQGSSSPSGG